MQNLELLLTVQHRSASRPWLRPGHIPASQFCPAPRTARGFSVIEMMIAMVLSLFLLGAIAYVVVNSNKNYTTTDSLSRLQENARFAMDLLTRDLRRSGHAGCLYRIKNDNVQNNLNDAAYGSGASIAEAEITPLDGVDNAPTGTTWSQSGLSILSGSMSLQKSGALVSGSDVLGIRYAETTALKLAQDMGNVADDVVIEDSPDVDIRKGSIVMMANCEAGDVFQVTDVAKGSGKMTLSHAAGSSPKPGNASPNLSMAYLLPTANQNPNPGTPSLLALTPVAYYIATNNNGQMALFRDSPTGSEEIVEGVESLQILYGVTDGTGTMPTIYVPADSVTASDWDNVVSVRIGMLLATVASTADGQYGIEKDTGSYNVNGQSVSVPTGQERRLRRVFETTVLLRNQ